jgi:hypothetical protein
MDERLRFVARLLDGEAMSGSVARSAFRARPVMQLRLACSPKQSRLVTNERNGKGSAGGARLSHARRQHPISRQAPRLKPTST